MNMEPSSVYCDNRGRILQMGYSVGEHYIYREFLSFVNTSNPSDKINFSRLRCVSYNPSLQPDCRSVSQVVPLHCIEVYCYLSYSYIQSTSKHLFLQIRINIILQFTYSCSKLLFVFRSLTVKFFKHFSQFRLCHVMLVSIFFNYFSNNIWWKGHCMSLKCVTYKLYQKGCPYRR